MIQPIDTMVNQDTLDAARDMLFSIKSEDDLITPPHNHNDNNQSIHNSNHHRQQQQQQYNNTNHDTIDSIVSHDIVHTGKGNQYQQKYYYQVNYVNHLSAYTQSVYQPMENLIDSSGNIPYKLTQYQLKHNIHDTIDINLNKPINETIQPDASLHSYNNENMPYNNNYQHRYINKRLPQLCYSQPLNGITNTEFTSNSSNKRIKHDVDQSISSYLLPCITSQIHCIDPTQHYTIQYDIMYVSNFDYNYLLCNNIPLSYTVRIVDLRDKHTDITQSYVYAYDLIQCIDYIYSNESLSIFDSYNTPNEIVQLQSSIQYQPVTGTRSLNCFDRVDPRCNTLLLTSNGLQRYSQLIAPYNQYYYNFIMNKLIKHMTD